MHSGTNFQLKQLKVRNMAYLMSLQEQLCNCMSYIQDCVFYITCDRTCFFFFSILSLISLNPVCCPADQELVICGEHTLTWGKPTIKSQTNTFMPEETMMLLREELGADGQLKLSGEYESIIFYYIGGCCIFLFLFSSIWNSADGSAVWMVFPPKAPFVLPCSTMVTITSTV